MPVPANIRIFHIVHVDCLPSILQDGFLWCDAEINLRNPDRTTIGMNKIKQRRLTMPLSSHPDLCVGECVPFYFCPRSVMLYLISQRNHLELAYCGGQEPIVHLECDMLKTIEWAEANDQRWAFTLSNAGSLYFEDRDSTDQLDEIDWEAVGTNFWKECREKKQAEFLVEHHFPWNLVERIGVHSPQYAHQVNKTISGAKHRPIVEVKRDWYY